eukprot:CAMPEP_0115857908 /NCGR_PEP_ID=MMETSP0287-20121206/15819_1 /TAXON_ID=412157 /ORGANISM="Chrysochromulina rotalis, Strain UIO044" /LENGTH=232 /DNA_ID=CAMNT_0003312145 /DNA_START=227 /DNA_END=929 /DNA_ORIENTATION=+
MVHTCSSSHQRAHPKVDIFEDMVNSGNHLSSSSCQSTLTSLGCVISTFVDPLQHTRLHRETDVLMSASSPALQVPAGSTCGTSYEEHYDEGTDIRRALEAVRRFAPPLGGEGDGDTIHGAEGGIDEPMAGGSELDAATGSEEGGGDPATGAGEAGGEPATASPGGGGELSSCGGDAPWVGLEEALVVYHGDGAMMGGRVMAEVQVVHCKHHAYAWRRESTLIGVNPICMAEV